MQTVRKAAFCAIATLAALTIFGLAHGTASAADKTLTMTPAATRPDVNPGATTTGSFQLLNQGQADFKVKLYTAPFFVKGEDYTPDFSPIPGRPDAASWLKLSVPQSTITPGQTLNVNYALSVPAGTQPGGYYAVAFAETQAPDANQGVIVNERIGEIFYITVAGPVKRSAKVLSWSSHWLQKPPLSATLRLENDGGVHYASNIHLVVRDIFGHPKYTLTTQKEILPQTIRRLPDVWQGAPALGLFKVTGSASLIGDTETLPTKYVLVMSTTARIIVAAIVVLIIVLVVVRLILGRRWAQRRSRKNR